MRATLNQRGATLLEVMVSLAVFAGLLMMLGMSVTTQANVIGDASDAHNTVIPAEVCLQRIRNELKSAVRGSPGYAITETSISFRPLSNRGYVNASDGDYTTLKNAGLLSTKSLAYSPYLKTISYDAANTQVLMTVTGTLPTGMKASEVLCSNVPLLSGNVNGFRFLNGDSAAASPPAADADTVVVMVRLTASRVSSAPGGRGATVSSDVGGIILSTKVRMFAELLVNSTRGAVTGA